MVQHKQQKQPLLIIKYDGESLASANSMKNIASHIVTLVKENRLVVVCSATKGTTDELINITRAVKTGNKKIARRFAKIMIDRHKRLARQIINKKQSLQNKVISEIESDSDELMALIDSMVLLGEFTSSMMDYVLSFGERLSIRLVAGAISDHNKKTVPLTGKEVGILTDSKFGEAKPLMDTTKLRVAKTINAILADNNKIPIVGGFVGSDQHGRLTTLGRGGSDYTATIIGACLHADEIWLMGIVDGLVTADPNIVKDAKILRHVSYAEAVEMALFGAKQIHPRTFEPVLLKEIPMRIRNSQNITDDGTLVTASPPEMVKDTVKCVSRIRGNGLIDIHGASMVGMPGTAAKIFTTLANAEVNVMMISQNPSESSITIVVKNADIDRAVNALELRLLGSIIKKLDVTVDMTIVALIGSGMRGTAGVASKVFDAMGSANINVVMITQGSSELNLAWVVRNSDADNAARAIHSVFDLGKEAKK